MNLYPSYRVEHILEMYAVSFMALLNEGYRVRHKHYEMMGHISDLPHMSKDARARFYQQLEWASTPASDILSSSGKGTLS